MNHMKRSIKSLTLCYLRILLIGQPIDTEALYIAQKEFDLTK